MTPALAIEQELRRAEFAFGKCAKKEGLKKEGKKE